MVGTEVVLFTDMVGSTEIRAKQGDVVADEIRRAHDAIVEHAVGEHGGRVVKGLGDGALAAFLATSDAVASAVAIQREVHRHGLRHPDRSFLLRVGISAGDVGHEDGDLFGTAVVEASRLCAAAQGGEILVGEAVRLLCRGRATFGFEPMGNLALKGLGEAVPAARVDFDPAFGDLDGGPVAFPPGLRSTVDVPYVGRPDLLDLLDEGWKAASNGACHAVFLAGEPGIGKTRSSIEVARRAHAEGAVVLYGHCDSDLAVPYQPFVEALGWYTAAATEPVLGRLQGELSRIVPEISSRADAPGPVGSDASTEQYRLFEAVASWIIECSASSGLVIVLDDLHWATKPTLAMLLHVLRAATTTLPAPRLLVVGTYRDTDVDRAHPLSSVLADLWRIGRVKRISVTRLTPEEVEVLVATIAGHRLDSEGRWFARLLDDETDGNPFFVTEVLRHLVETGALRREGERWTIPHPDHLSVPEGVRDVIGRRLSQLSGGANSVLSMASVVGREFDVELLGAVTDLDEDDLIDVLDEVVRARLIQEVSQTEFRFVHALVQTTLYEELSATRRRLFHHRVSDILEKLRPRDVVALARHAVLSGPIGGHMDHAITYIIAAGEQAQQLPAFSEAEEHFRHALELIEAHEAPGSRLELDALCGLGEVLRDEGDPSFRGVLLTAARLAESAGDTEMLVRAALANSTGLVGLLGEVDRDVVAVLEAALAAVGEEPSPERSLLLAQLATELLWMPGSRRVELAEEAQGIARAGGDAVLLGEVLVRSWIAASTSDRWCENLEVAHELERMARGCADPSWRVRALLAAAPMLLAAGEVVPSRKCIELANSIAETEGTPSLRHTAANLWILHVAGAGRFEEAEELNIATRALGAEIGLADVETYFVASQAAIAMMRGTIGEMADIFAVLAETYPVIASWRAAQVICLALDGRLDEARRVLRSNPPDFEMHRLEPFQFTPATVLGTVAHHLGDAELGRRVHDELTPYVGRWTSWGVGTMGPVEFGLGAAESAIGDHAASIDHLRHAAEVCEEVGFSALSDHIDCYRARVLMSRDGPSDLDAALEVARRAHSRSAEIGATGNAEWTARIIADCEARQDMS